MMNNFISQMTSQGLSNRIKEKRLQRAIFRLCKIYQLLLIAFHTHTDDGLNILQFIRNVN